MAAVTAATACSNATDVAAEVLVTPLTLRTYCRAAASISSAVAGGSRPRRVVMFRHMDAERRTGGAGVLGATVAPVLPPSPLSWRVRIVRVLASWVGVAIGVSLLLRSELGVAPFDVFNSGVAEATGWSFGTCFTVDAMGMYLLGFLLGAPPGPASVIGNFAIGPMIDLALALFPEQDALAVRVPLLVIGLLVLAVAICLVISTDLGAGPTEVVMLGLVRHRVPVVPARWVSDGVPMLVGVALGGALGVGTIAFLVLMAPMVQYGLRRLGYVPRSAVAAA